MPVSVQSFLLLSSCQRPRGRSPVLTVCAGSYQWDVQATVLRIAKSMRERGFRVWMDTEMMTGSTLDAMAAAVEGAHCVLICITERYKVRTRATTCCAHRDRAWSSSLFDRAWSSS